MAKKPALSDITDILNSTVALNSNWDSIQNAFNNTLSLDGSLPNAMTADLDLNGNDVINAGLVDTNSLHANLIQIAGVNLTDAVFTPSWKGAWTTGTQYALNNLVSFQGSSYIALVEHTSGADFSTDLSMGKWSLFAKKGDSGSGTGDVIAANNGSEYIGSETAFRANLGLIIGQDIQAFDQALSDLSNLSSVPAEALNLLSATTKAAQRTSIEAQKQDPVLDDLAGLTLAQGDILYYNGTNLVRLPKGTANQHIVMNSGGTAPVWGDSGLGSGQTWQNVSRAKNTVYTNDTGKPIQVAINRFANDSSQNSFQVDDGSGFVTVGVTAPGSGSFVYAIVPDGHSYRVTGGGTSWQNWSELR